MTTPSGTIHSPNYPNMYNHDDDCGWLITVDMNHVVELTFSDFDLEHQTNCRYFADSVLILDHVNNIKVSKCQYFSKRSFSITAMTM